MQNDSDINSILLKMKLDFDKLPQHNGYYRQENLYKKIHAGKCIPGECDYDLRDSPGAGTLTSWTCCNSTGDNRWGCMPDPEPWAHWTCCSSKEHYSIGCSTTRPKDITYNCSNKDEYGCENQVFCIKKSHYICNSCYAIYKIKQILNENEILLLKGDIRNLTFDLDWLVSPEVSANQIKKGRR